MKDCFETKLHISMSKFWFRLLLISLIIGRLRATVLLPPAFEFVSTSPDIYRNSTQLIKSRGFDFETHQVITKDGYILGVIRIVNPFVTDTERAHLRPFYLQHGLAANSDFYLLTLEGGLTDDGRYAEFVNGKTLITDCTGRRAHTVGQSLAFVLAACGYDVWLGNYRGTRYSREHVLLTKEDEDFWLYSVDELGLFDIPATIEYILAATGRGELGYVGHSLGTAGMFQLLSIKPEFSKYIRPYIALAPVAYVAHIRQAFLQLAAHNDVLIKWLGHLRTPIFGLPNEQLSLLNKAYATFICGNMLLHPFCTWKIYDSLGYDANNTDRNLITSISSHFPDEQSARIISHLGQRVARETFSFYDFGSAKNMERYRSPHPPIYNLSRIENRYMILVSGLNDILGDRDDLQLLRNQLTVRPYADYIVPFTDFSHIDFASGNNAGELQNAPLLRWIREIYDQSK